MTGTPETILDLPLTPSLPDAAYFETTVAGASVRVEAAVIAAKAPPLAIAQSSSVSYTFVIGDAGTYIQFTSASPISVIIPTNASVAFVVGTTITLEQNGGGAITVSASGGVTLRSNGGKVTTNGQYAVISMVKVATNTWTLFGNLV